MNKIKLIFTVALAFVVLFAQAGNAAAAPLAQDPAPITGIVTNISLETNANGVTTVLVTLDNLSVIQTVRISDDTAFALGLLLTLDPPVVDTTKINTHTTISIPAIEVIPVAEPAEEAVHPIAALLAGFFGEDTSVINDYHNDGFGFGIIAQALWMSRNLTGTEEESGDASLASQILAAKESGDYSAFTLPDGTVPTNWGQFRKAVSNKKNNLGVIISGHADESNTPVQPELGNGNGNGQDQGNGNGNNNGNGHGNGNSQNKNKDKGKDN